MVLLHLFIEVLIIVLLVKNLIRKQSMILKLNISNRDGLIFKIDSKKNSRYSYKIKNIHEKLKIKNSLIFANKYSRTLIQKFDWRIIIREHE